MIVGWGFRVVINNSSVFPVALGSFAECTSMVGKSVQVRATKNLETGLPVALAKQCEKSERTV